MNHFAGLDISVKETSVCIVDDTGRDRSRSEGGERAGGALAVLANPAYRSSGSDWKPDRCRSGCSALSPKRAAGDLCLRRGTCERH